METEKKPNPLLQLIARPAVVWVMLLLGLFFTLVFVANAVTVPGYSPGRIGYVVSRFLFPMLLAWAFFYRISFKTLPNRKLVSFATAFCLFSFFGLGNYHDILRSAPASPEEEQIPVILKQLQVNAAEQDRAFHEKFVQLAATPTAEQLADTAKLPALAATAKDCTTLAHSQMPLIESSISDAMKKINALHIDEALKQSVVNGAMKGFATTKPLLERYAAIEIHKCDVNTKMVALAQLASPTLSPEHKLQFTSQADMDNYAAYLKEDEQVLADFAAINKEMTETAEKLAKH